MSKVFTEITRLSDKDCFYIVERHKTEFTYPLHRHKEFELNFIQNGKGVRRIVGDSVEEVGDYKLVLIGAKILSMCGSRGSANPKTYVKSLSSSRATSSAASCFQRTSLPPSRGC